MSNALNDKDQVEEKLILAARHLAKQNDEKQPKDDLDISGELLNDMVIWDDKFPREGYKKKDFRPKIDILRVKSFYLV